METHSTNRRSQFPLWPLGFGVMILAVAATYYATNFMAEPRGETDADLDFADEHGGQTHQLMGTVLHIEGTVAEILDKDVFVLQDHDESATRLLVFTHRLQDAPAENPIDVSANMSVLVDGKVVPATEEALRRELGENFDPQVLRDFDGKYAMIAQDVQSLPADRGERDVR